MHNSLLLLTQSDDSGESTKTERFKEEKEWLELQEALARIAYAKGVDNYDEYQRRLANLQVEYEQSESGCSCGCFADCCHKETTAILREYGLYAGWGHTEGSRG